MTSSVRCLCVHLHLSADVNEGTRSAEVRKRGLPGRRWGARTHLHQLLLRPDLNGLHLLRRLRLDPVRVEENLEAEARQRGALGTAGSSVEPTGRDRARGSCICQQSSMPSALGPRGLRTSGGSSGDVPRRGGDRGQAQDWGIPLICVLVFQCCIPCHTGAGHSG